jgi:hypothetical protein
MLRLITVAGFSILGFLSVNLFCYAKTDLLKENSQKNSLPLTTQKTECGFTFDSNSYYPFLGEAWKDDEYGIIWGDIIIDAKGNEIQFNQQDAINYCKSIGAELPSYGDYTALIASLCGNVEGYTVDLDILPNLKGHIFWSSTTWTTQGGSLVFRGDPDEFGDYNCSMDDQWDVRSLESVRCVMHQAR